jgi:hypothetical protein
LWVSMPKIETVRFNGRTISEVRKKFRQWYEDNRAKNSIINEYDIERLQLDPLLGERQHELHGQGPQDVYTMLVEYQSRSD